MDEQKQLAELAERLRDAHRRVAALSVDPAEKASITRHLLAISDASKHSVPRAAERLEAFLADLDVHHPAPPD